MADFNTYRDADDTERHFKTIDGDGTSGDPAVPAHGILDSAGGEVLGTTTTAAVTSDTNGSAIGFLRGLVKWAYEKMPASLGQKAKSASLPVTLASDEDVVHENSTSFNYSDKGIPMQVVRRDLPGAYASDGEYAVPGVDNLGRLWVHVDKILDLGSGGQYAKSTSISVVPASDWDLPDTAAGDLAAIVAALAAQLPASLGQKAKAASLPVTLASDQELPDTAGGDLAKISTPMPASVGQKAMANSFPVALASDQSNLGISTGATDDAAAAGQIFPMAGLYDDTATDEVDEGDVGRMRMSARRATLYASDYLLTEVDAADINSGYVVIDGVTFQSLQALKMGSEDGVTYGTTAGIVIPMATKRWKSLWLAIKNGATAHDQAIAVSVYISPQNDTALSNPRARVAQFTIPTTADLSVVVGEGTVGQGGNAGIATATNLALYALTVPRSTPYVQILLSGTLPTTGAFASIEIGRFS